MDHPYQIALACGVPTSGLAGLAQTVVDITPGAATGSASASALGAAGLTPADLRAKAIFAGGGDLIRALVSWSTLCGFAARRIDVATSAGSFSTEGIRLELPERPEEPVETVRIDVAAFPAPGDRPATTALRYAQRCEVVIPSGYPLHDALVRVALVAALRAYPHSERLPVVVIGAAEFDLNEAFHAGAALRRTMNAAATAAITTSTVPSPRQVRLELAAQFPVEIALDALLSTHRHPLDQEDGTVRVVWHCPRHWRHSHGDATPSAKVADGKFRCARCDREPLDSLRLVAETLDVAADEAADLIEALRAGEPVPVPGVDQPCALGG